MRCRSAVASTSWPARVRRVASRTVSRFSIVSPRSVGESGLDRGSGMKGAQRRDRGDGGAGQLGSDVLGDGRETQHVDVQHLAGAPRCFEILAGVISQPEVQALPGRGLPDDVRVAFELVPDGRPDEIRPVRIEPLLHHEIDVAEVDIAKVARDLLGVGGLGSQSAHIIRHEITHLYHPLGWSMDVKWMLRSSFQGAAVPLPNPRRAARLVERRHLEAGKESHLPCEHRDLALAVSGAGSALALVATAPHKRVRPTRVQIAADTATRAARRQARANEAWA